MKDVTKPVRAPRPLKEHPRDPTRALLSAASRLEPAEGAQARVWRRLVEAHAPLALGEASAAASLLSAARHGVEPADDAQDEIWAALLAQHPELGVPDAATTLVAVAKDLEPADGTREEIWARILEESQARAGVAEPIRLGDSRGALGRLLSTASRYEPPLGRRTRVLGALEGRRSTGWAFGGLGLAAAAALLFAVYGTFDASPAAPEVALAVGGTAAGAPALDERQVTPVTAKKAFSAVAGRVLTPGPEDRIREQAPGIGDVVLAGATARLEVSKADATGIRLELSGGRVAIHAAKRPKNAPLVIATAGVEVKVVGTIFAVDALPHGAAVQVTEGIVEVRYGRTSTYLRAGDARVFGTSTAPVGWAEVLLSEVTPKAKMPVATLLRPPVAPAPVVQSPREIAVAFVNRLQDSSKALRKLSVDELRSQARAALEAKEYESAARAMLALSGHPSVPAAERAATLQRVAALFDESLRKPWAAVVLREGIARSASQGAEAKFELMLGLWELGAIEDARTAAEACVAGCSEEHRPIALFVRARVLQEAGDPSLLEAARELRSAPGGAQATALNFVGRATRFHALGQLERARRDAAFALALDPNGPSATGLRDLLGDR